MTKLNDTQRVLLAAAAKGESGSIYPLPDTLVGKPHVGKAIANLLERALIEERETRLASEVYRSDDGTGIGLYVTAAGLEAIGITAGDDAGSGSGSTTDASAALASTNVEAAAARTTNKTAAVIALLSRAEGATLDQMVAATGWLPHTTRAALTGLKKKGHSLSSIKTDGVRIYRIAGGA